MIKKTRNSFGYINIIIDFMARFFLKPNYVWFHNLQLFDNNAMMINQAKTFCCSYDIDKYILNVF